uniref:FSH1 domain-containing protein n=1 Tax=Rhabditophanes sp. KR3021 TaxID=114890 RepID=A0AC35U023_9BILA
MCLIPKKKLKILCLHGYRQNGTMFREKTGGLRKGLKGLCEFDFVSGPLVPTIPNEEGDVGKEVVKSIPPADTPRGWWFSKEEKTFSSKDICINASGFDEGVQTVVNHIKENGPYDGLLGFSQGGAMVHLLSVMASRKEIEKNFRFIIMMSSFKSLAESHKELVEHVVEQLPSMHIYGIGDQVVNHQRSIEVTLKFANPSPSILIHEGGHCVPPMSLAKKPLQDFLNQFIDEPTKLQ